MATVLAIAVMALSAYGFFLFNRNIIFGKEKPNAASWNLWVLFSLVNATSYFAMNGDWIKLALPAVDTTLCIVTWLVALFGSHFQWPPKRDWFAIVLTLVALVVWKVSSATNANMFAQLPFMISFFPYFVHAWEKKVEAKPWFVWTAAFTINLGLVYVRHANLYDFAYPVVGVVLHGTVAAIAWYRPMARAKG